MERRLPPALAHHAGPCRGADNGRRLLLRRPGPEDLRLGRYLGYFEQGPRFGLTLDEYPHLLEGASWATWDSGKCLWVARPGIVEQYTLDDLRRGQPSYSLDLDQFEPPTKPGA